MLFEAARWAPSSGNTQPWRMLYAHRDTQHWPLFFGLLVERNQVWCRNAAVLVVFVSRTTQRADTAVLSSRTATTPARLGEPRSQGTLSGLVVHGMAGFDYARAKTTLNIPDDFHD